MAKRLGLLVALLMAVVPAAAQQTGSIGGTVTLSDGSTVPGVVVEATSTLLPRPRATTTLANGYYTLAQLPPGDYRVTFAMSGVETVTREVRVSLDRETSVDVTLGLDTVSEAIEVVAEASLIDRTSAEIRSGVGAEALELLPVGQDYRDLQKLIPGVQYSELTIRGPSAGGSGQDNTYLFDGVSVNLPLFGTLSAEPSNHDVEQVSMVKGGARAVGFNRSGGFSMDTVSKSGTDRWRGEASYQIQTEDLVSDREQDNPERFDEDRDWATLGLGGPLWRDNLYFYGSYFRPTRERDNSATAYGPSPNFESTRNELFGKMTWTPSNSVLIHGSYRDSDREDEAASIGPFAAGSTAVVEEATLKIAIGEGSWVINDRNLVTFKVTDFENRGLARPLTLIDTPVALDGSVRLDVNNLDRLGHLFVPTLRAGLDAHNAFVTPFIERYGYLSNGVRTGGGDLGAHHEFDDAGYFRQSLQVGYDFAFGDRIGHDLHVGYQWFSDEEQLQRSSNGWGRIDIPGGRTTFQGQPVFFTATLFAGAAGVIPVGDLTSEYESHNIEVNDTIRWNNWTFNVGVLLSQDTLYGQGLREDSSKVSGFSVAPGNKYEMYEIDWDELIQPRLGATWAYNGRDTAYASYARYNPAASSLPRAASWDRNFFLRTVEVHFDADGDFIGSGQVAGSSGKLFSDDLDPRYVDEFLVGTARQLGDRWTARLYGRYRYSTSFWEDTNNNARINFQPPPGVPRELYIPTNDLVGTGSYVIAELDGAFTKYYEATIETERRYGKTSFRGSYTWSHYYGTFDQDNTSGDVIDNDLSTFIGSSNLADGAGRQMWDMKYGNLHGDRRHLLKLYGSLLLPWNASVGAFAVYQDGQPWEAWDSEVYRHLTTSTSNTIRFAEPAGSRRSEDHYQVDLNYTQSFPFGGRYVAQLIADVYNLTDNQTGFAPNPIVSSPRFGRPTEYYDPRRLRLAVKLQF